MTKNTIDYFEVIQKLIGPVEPVGETREDDKRLENLEHWCELTEKMAEVLWNVQRHRNDYRGSLQVAGKTAHKSLMSIRDWTEVEE